MSRSMEKSRENCHLGIEKGLSKYLEQTLPFPMEGI